MTVLYQAASLATRVEVAINEKTEFVSVGSRFAKLGAIGRMAGITYCRTADRFELKRPG